jgi:integrase
LGWRIEVGYTNGLKKEGEVYVFRFVYKKELHKGSTGCAVHEDAVAWLKKHRSEIALLRKGIHKEPTLRGLLKSWKEVAPLSNKQQQIDTMDSAITTYFEKHLDQLISELTTVPVAKALLAYRKSKGTGPGRKSHSTGGSNALLLRLNTLMNHAIRCGMIAKMPYDVSTKASQQKHRNVVRASRVKDFLVALDSSVQSSHMKLAILLQMGLGLRESEALGLDWKFIDWEADAFLIGRYVKSDLTGEEEFETKGKEADELPPPRWLRERLHAHWEDCGKPSEGLILPGPESGVPHPAGYTAKAIARIGRKMKLGKLRPHDLRASFITSLLNDAKIHLTQVRDMARHKDITTTMKYDQGVESHREAMERWQKVQGFNISNSTGFFPRFKGKIKFRLKMRKPENAGPQERLAS